MSILVRTYVPDGGSGLAGGLLTLVMLDFLVLGEFQQVSYSNH